MVWIIEIYSQVTLLRAVVGSLLLQVKEFESLQSLGRVVIVSRLQAISPSGHCRCPFDHMVGRHAKGVYFMTGYNRKRGRCKENH